MNINQNTAFLIRNLLIFVVVCVFMIFLFSQPTPMDDFSQNLKKMRRQYLEARQNETKAKMLEDVLTSSRAPRKDLKSIFFIESRAATDKVLKLTARQACSVEAAAAMNPDLDVFVLFSYEVGFLNTTPLPLIDALLTYKNVFLRQFKVEDYVQETPLEDWFKNGKISSSRYYVYHVSDILRVLTLWKYTGLYLDGDVIVRKPVSTIGTNFACIQEDGLINSAIMSFDDKLGRSLAEKNFKEVIEHFNGDTWTGNGPEILSNLVKKMCNTTEPNKMTRKNCNGFEVLPTEACYAINYPEGSQKFFNSVFLEEVLHKTKDSFAIHFWNVMTEGTNASTSSNAPYVIIAREYCPKVYAASGANF